MFTDSSSLLMKIQEGMTQQEVRKIMGTPSYRRFDNMGEQWEYRTAKIGGYNVAIIDFTNGNVSALNSYFDIVQDTSATEQPLLIPSSTISTTDRLSRAMSMKDFDSFYSKVKNKPFKDDQMELISVGVAGSWLTCSQCARLMSIFTWDDERMKVVEMISNRIADKENSEVIIKALNSLFKQDDARKILKRYN